MSLVSTGQGLSKLKKKHFRVKHQKVKLFRANEPFLSVLMWGINHTVGIFTLFLSVLTWQFFLDKRTNARYNPCDAVAR